MRRSGLWWVAAGVVWCCATRGAGDWSDCGHVAGCACKWSSGKKSATCPAVGLRALPALSPDIQVLDLHNNAIDALGADAFVVSGLLNLQRLNLRAARLRTLHADAFRELRILVELDLADNALVEIPRGTFRGNERLRLLVLSGNPLAALPRDQFPPLPRLRSLELAGCHLRSLHSAALQPEHLPLLDSVDLRGNLLTRLRVRALANLPALKTLAVSGNPWQCDCRLRDFRDWYLTSNLGTEEVTCAGPPLLAGARWRDVPSKNMTCAPEMMPSTKILRAEAGTDVSFGCFARGDPTPLVVWLIGSYLVDNETFSGDIRLEKNTVRASEEDRETGIISDGHWVNVSIANATNEVAGDWTCTAISPAGKAHAVVTLVLPRARTATARSPPEYPPAVGALAGAVISLFALGVVSTCACWHARRRRSQPTRSFSDQEKKLLKTSLATGGDRSSADFGSYELPARLPERGFFGSDPMHITIEGGGAREFPPPPAEFALPEPYGNIFISVSVTGRSTGAEAEAAAAAGHFPDLLGSVGGSTLPRRVRGCCAVPSYDNMGPRVTAGGSSTWSLPGAGAAEVTSSPAHISSPPPPIVLTPPPPPEFVSL